MERYAIEKRIGTGSYGTAYLVHMKSDRCASPIALALPVAHIPILPGAMPEGCVSLVAVHEVDSGREVSPPLTIYPAGRLRAGGTSPADAKPCTRLRRIAGMV
jgi:hypothetical protein